MSRALKRFGPYDISLIIHDYVWLDGGAMFGSVPKPLWSRGMPPDDKNRIKLATRSLLLEGEGKKILVDVGCGTKWSEKEQKIFNFQIAPEEERNFTKSEITDVILTHLHFDHAGGMTHLNDADEPTLSYPDANIYVSNDNYQLGLEPNIRERASYLASHIEPLQDGNLIFTYGSQEIIPHIWVHPVNGHTEGQQYIEIRVDEESILFPTDLIPTSHHLPLPYHMGYDMCAKTVLEEKKQFLEYALVRNAIVVFEHDPEIAAATIGINERGHFAVANQIA